MLSKEKDEITVSGFAEYFQVSQKTIRNDLKEINGVLKENKKKEIVNKKKEIVIKSGGKIKIPENFENSLSVLIEGNLNTYKLSKEERKQIAAAMIVNSTGYITLATIADCLLVSRATIINDLKKIKEFIRQGNLDVSSHANKGLLIEGAESDKRKFLFRLLSPSICTYENQKSVVAEYVNVQAGDQNIIQKILSEQEERYKKHLSDQSFREITLFLRIMINRNQQGEFLESQTDKDSENYMFALDILKYISQYCNITISEDDIRSLSGFLDRMRYIKSESFHKNTVVIQMVTREYISGVSGELGVNLNMDYDFFENLSNHLESIFSAPPMEYQGRQIS